MLFWSPVYLITLTQIFETLKKKKKMEPRLFYYINTKGLEPNDHVLCSNSSAFQLTSIVPDSEVSIPGLWRGFEVESVPDCGHVSVCGTDELNHLENSQLNKSPQKELAYFVKHL